MENRQMGLEKREKEHLENDLMRVKEILESKLIENEELGRLNERMRIENEDIRGELERMREMGRRYEGMK